MEYTDSMNTHTRSTLLGVILIIFAGVLLYLVYLTTRVTPNGNPVPVSKGVDPLNTTYIINDVPIAFLNGMAETNTSGTKVTSSFFGQPVIGDINGDGINDAVSYITQNQGGSGTFFYVVAAIATTNTTVGTNAILLGDRIAPQNIQIQNGSVIANYADRKPGEPMTTRPSEEVSAYLVVMGTTLKRIPAPTNTIAYLVSPQDSTSYCNGDVMDTEGYRKTITLERATSTPETNPTNQQLIKQAIDLATTGMCRTVLSQLDITESNGIVTIPPIDGWAGISIAMCSCKPQVEVNLLRMPGVTKVVWQ